MTRSQAYWRAVARPARRSWRSPSAAPLEPLVERHELARVVGLEHERVLAGHRVVLARAAGAGDAAGRHGLEPDQPEGLVPAVGEHRVGARGTGRGRPSASSVRAEEHDVGAVGVVERVRAAPPAPGSGALRSITCRPMRRGARPSPRDRAPPCRRARRSSGREPRRLSAPTCRWRAASACRDPSAPSWRAAARPANAAPELLHGAAGRASAKASPARPLGIDQRVDAERPHAVLHVAADGGDGRRPPPGAASRCDRSRRCCWRSRGCSTRCAQARAGAAASRGAAPRAPCATPRPAPRRVRRAQVRQQHFAQQVRRQRRRVVRRLARLRRRRRPPG